MDGTIYVILKVLVDFALEVWFSILSHINDIGSFQLGNTCICMP